MTCAAFYLQAKTARRAKNNTMRLLAEANIEKQEMLSDIRVLVAPCNPDFIARSTVTLRWQKELGLKEKNEEYGLALGVNIYREVMNKACIKAGRAVGNTTRLADEIIQNLFEGKKVAIIDHSGTRAGTENLHKIVLGRLEREHGLRTDQIRNSYQRNALIISIESQSIDATIGRTDWGAV